MLVTLVVSDVVIVVADVAAVDSVSEALVVIVVSLAAVLSFVVVV